jgi:hypothetical protein
VDVANTLSKLSQVFPLISCAYASTKRRNLLVNLAIPFLLDCLVAKPNFAFAR